MRVRYQIGTGPMAVRGAAAARPSVGVTMVRAPLGRAKATTVRAGTRLRIPTPAALAILALAGAGCAGLEPMREQALRIAPVLDVRSSAVAADGYYALGRYHDGMRAWDKAVDAYWQAIAAHPRHAEAYNALGVALAQLGRHDDAELALRRAVAIEPERAHLHSNLGLAMLMAGRLREALVELKLAVKLDPGNATARGNLRDAVARWEDLQAGETQAAAAPPRRPVAMTTPASALGRPMHDLAPRADGGAPAVAAATTVEGTQTIAVATPITLAELAEPLSERVDVPAPPSATPPTARVVDRPTIPAWPRAGATAAHATPAAPPAPLTAAAPMAAARGAALAGQPGVRLELSNGNGVPGMAARLGQWLASQGVQASRLSNRRPFIQAQTVIEYRHGREEAALQVARALPLATRVGPALRADLRSDVRVVLGRDWRTAAACMERNTCAPAATVLATRAIGDEGAALPQGGLAAATAAALRAAPER